MHDTPRGWRAGKLDHDLPAFAQIPHRYPDDFEAVMARIGGGTTFEEVSFLAEQARAVETGCIVEIGSFKGRSAVALSLGARAGGHSVQVYCIEPHAPFTGLFGGAFGPSDRAQFYSAMLATGAFANTALINLSSEDVTPAWTRDVALCFIDGDHSYAGVRRDFECWAGKVARGGLLILDDTTHPQAGPTRLKAELLTMPEWLPIEAPGKFAAFRKRGVEGVAGE